MKEVIIKKPILIIVSIFLLINYNVSPASSFLNTSRIGRKEYSLSLRRKTLFLSAIKKQQQQQKEDVVLRTNNLSSDRDDSISRSIIEEEGTILGFPKKSVATPLGLLLVSQFLLFIGVGAVIPSIPLYGKEIGLSSASNGLIISAPAVALLLGAKLGGNFADKARKPAMLIGMALVAVSDLGTALANGLVSVTIARLGLGAGRCINEAGERGMLADLAGRAPELRGRALSAQQATIALGIAIGAPLGGVVVERFGPRAAFLIVTAAALMVCVLYLFLPETINYNTSGSSQSRSNNISISNDYNKQTTTADVIVVGDGSDNENNGEWTKLLSSGTWRGLALCQCGASFGFAAKIASIPLIATSILPGGAAGAGALISIAGLSGIVGAPIGGWLTDQTSAKSTAMLSGLVSSTGLVLIPVALSFTTETTPLIPFLSEFLENTGLTLQAAAFSACAIVWSMGASAQGPALTALAQEMAPLGSEATAMALPRATGDATYIFAPFLLGLVADRYSLGTPGIECAVAGTATLLGVMALLWSSLMTEEEKPLIK
mmetsp:Transcript_1070/g.1356  ORF Transcript_1070/g.1356 Transcript_1070/m.1356 type:complete len:548 (+) Transcript_1070:92-1735(+)